MLKFPICQDEINILYLRDIEHLLENESIHLLVVEQLDSKMVYLYIKIIVVIEI